jgi:TRAP-type uncharacterized transport system fused permease subunit
MSAPDTQAAIAAAVTPVVMISANAILIGAISSKHQSMSDRLRALTAEFRHSDTSDDRRTAISAQLRLFDRRLLWVTWSHIVLYAATACFILMVIDIAISSKIESWKNISLGLLIAGVSLMFAGIILELLDLAKARQTLHLETNDLPR